MYVTGNYFKGIRLKISSDSSAFPALYKGERSCLLLDTPPFFCAMTGLNLNLTPNIGCLHIAVLFSAL